MPMRFIAVFIVAVSPRYIHLAGNSANCRYTGWRAASAREN